MKNRNDKNSMKFLCKNSSIKTDSFSYLSYILIILSYFTRYLPFYLSLDYLTSKTLYNQCKY